MFKINPNDLPDSNDNKLTLEKCQYYVDNIDMCIELLSKNIPSHNSIEFRALFKNVDDLKFVKICAESYLTNGKSRNWKVERATTSNILNFLTEFKNSGGSVDVCKKFVL